MSRQVTSVAPVASLRDRQDEADLPGRDRAPRHCPASASACVPWWLRPRRAGGVGAGWSPVSRRSARPACGSGRRPARRR